MDQMELLPRHHADFRRKEYWDEFFTKRQEKAFEWYGEYSTLRPALHKSVKPSDRILVVGCGNSDLSPEWAQDGFTKITSMDFSALVIEEMRQKHPSMTWDVMDMTNMTYAKESFDCIMDKGALDALMATNDEAVLADALKMFNEVDRILAPGGSYICITMAQDFIIQHLLSTFCESLPSYKITALDVPRSKASPFVPFFIAFTKTSKPSERSMVKYNGKFFLHEDGLPRKQWLVHELEATQWYTMTQSELKKIQVGRQRVIELMTSASTTLNTTPRYTIRLVDVHAQGPNGACGVFLIPQGREHEYLFATEEGAMELASGAGFSRFLIVSLGRTHTFESLEAVQLELNAKVMELIPDSLNKGEKIPYMTVEEGLGERHIVAQGTTEMSGDYFIEEVDMHRRLIFLTNNNTIQSEIQLLPPLTAKQLKQKAKKNKNKNETVNVRLRFDPTYLAFEYHKSMAALLQFSMHSKPETIHKSLLVGLGGGCLASYIQATMPKVSLTACELDPSIVTVAKEYFGFQTNNNLQVIVQNGLECIKNAAPNSLDSILIDVDAKSSHEKSIGLAAPPVEFVAETFLIDAYQALNPNGMFLANVSCRSSELYKDILAKLHHVFGCKENVLELKASENDVNRIICAVKGGVVDLKAWRKIHVATLPGFDEDELENLMGLLDIAE
ncbi:Aste57867_170 [Aphanomyces stellatus]|uniref:Aste57867_170 protein n=1 Tax=Aphanomyces stellatus TaxID=120398 RepID=A0A485K4H5_9STRA|nr:hypothetical protein As57867_000170 [Aphanomyces stellatus]VFT77396.1 Aste57867_170 [Aphanomyces stellatus]